MFFEAESLRTNSVLSVRARSVASAYSDAGAPDLLQVVPV